MSDIFAQTAQEFKNVAVAHRETALNGVFSKTAQALEEMTTNHADGGIVQNKQLSWLAEEGPEAVIPLEKSSRASSLYQTVGQLLGERGGTESTISYSPTLQFYGGTPSREDLDGALKMSQSEFNSMMERYLSGKRRVAF